jgi:uncharacterized cofD-like protein
MKTSTLSESQAPKFVVIGGGTGSFTLLTGLKRHVSDITALVNMTDDSASNRVLFDEQGVLPAGDIRQCLVALSDSSTVRELFNYQFEDGAFKGQSFGNLFLSTVEKMSNSFEDAVALASDVLHIQGKVLPVTTTHTKIRVTESKKPARPLVQMEPAAPLTEAGREAILTADMIVIAPGNLYGSLAPALMVHGMRDALQKTQAKIVYVCNLVNKPDYTAHFSVSDYAAEIERFIGSKVLDYVIYNTDEPPVSLLDKYMRDGETIVGFDLDELDMMHYHAVGLPLIAQDPITNGPHDAARSLIRHDDARLARQLMSIYFE